MYTPVAKLVSIQTILAIATQLNLELHRLDIKSAYLNGELGPKEVIYMKLLKYALDAACCVVLVDGAGVADAHVGM